VRVLILGGTAEARALATELHDRGIDVTTSLAGRTDHPNLPLGAVRIGGYGPEGLTDYLWTEGFEWLIDATHPFSATISAAAVTASQETGVPLIRLQRPGWEPAEGDDWTRVPDMAAAAEVAAKSLPGMVFVTTGRRGISVFAPDSEHDFLIRMATEPDEALPPRTRLIVSRGPFTLEGEAALLREHQVRLLVTKDSGGDATDPKLAAARAAEIPVVVIDRPPVPQAEVIAPGVDEVLRLLGYSLSER
jgi:precorrin-6A/cobalt-precorrin-6A reductase